MNCQRHEEGLLLLAHNAATPLQRWRLRRHLDTCPDCQARLQRLQRTSLALAEGIRRGGDLPAWRLPALSAALPLRPQRLPSAPLLIAAAAAAAGLATVGYEAYRMAYPPQPACKTGILVASPPPVAAQQKASSLPPGRRYLRRVVP